MAITAATKTTDFSGFLHAEQAGPIFANVYKNSVVQRLARKVPLGLAGTEVPVVTGAIAADWVAEAGLKPASNAAMTLKTMTPKKIAAIAVVSAEVVRANPGGYMDVLRPQIAEAFALAFDAAVLHGTSTPFTAASGLAGTTKSVALGTKTAASGGIHGDLNSALRLLVNDSKRLTGFALDSKLEPDLLGSLDTAGRPLYIESPYDETAPASRGGRLIGRPATMGDSVGAYTAATGVAQVMGFAGDWNQVVWGQIGGITYDVSTEAAVTINGSLVSLWQNNLVAIRAETEFGVLINDLAAFCKLTRTNA